VRSILGLLLVVASLVATLAVPVPLLADGPHVGAFTSTDSPGYFDAHRKPTAPRDVLNHQCIRFRHLGDGVYKWECDKSPRAGTRKSERVERHPFGARRGGARSSSSSVMTTSKLNAAPHA
jgi:hypothetical protein